MPLRHRRLRPIQPIKPFVAPATHASAGTEALYRKKLILLINEMYVDVSTKVRGVYKLEESKIRAPEMAQDARPADILQRTMEGLAEEWLFRFDRLSSDMANWFARDVDQRSAQAMRAALRKGGMSVKFQQSPAMKDVMSSTVYENVRLIKSIPEKFLDEVQGMVMRSVQQGRDLGTLSKELRQEYGITRRRAELIARDQNNKATSALNKVRQLENGIEEGIWLHSRAGKEPRPKHVAADGVRFKIAEGLPVGDKGQYVMPGEEINCRCSWKAVVPGFS